MTSPLFRPIPLDLPPEDLARAQELHEAFLLSQIDPDALDPAARTRLTTQAEAEAFRFLARIIRDPKAAKAFGFPDPISALAFEEARIARLGRLVDRPDLAETPPPPPDISEIGDLRRRLDAAEKIAQTCRDASARNLARVRELEAEAALRQEG